MRRLLFAFVLASGLCFASPVLAKEPQAFIPRIGHYFMVGARFYVAHVNGWINALLTKLGLQERRVVTVVQENGSCDGSLPCIAGTYCTRTCAPGEPCRRSFCLKPANPTGSCAVDAECRAVCAGLRFPDIGPSGFIARCASGSCLCDPISIVPNASRIACPSSAALTLVCPAETIPGCAQNGAVYQSCLASPDDGGTCLADVECGNECPQGGQAFCAEDGQCKCRRTEAQSVACATSADCAAAGCAASEVAACLNNACACAPAGTTTACQAASDCAACPTGYAPACTNGECACQRTTENVPLACETVSDCGTVSCPSGYDKACLNSICSCSRAVQPQ